MLRVTHCLETHKTIAGEDLIAVIEGRQGPLIDGRVYHEPDLVESLEQYHAMVLAAHKSHSDVSIKLPGSIEVEAVPEDAPVPEPVPALPSGGEAYPPPYGQQPYPSPHQPSGEHPQPPYPPAPPPNGH